jgi:hypothetical protein
LSQLLQFWEAKLKKKIWQAKLKKNKNLEVKFLFLFILGENLGAWRPAPKSLATSALHVNVVA